MYDAAPRRGLPPELNPVHLGDTRMAYLLARAYLIVAHTNGAVVIVATRASLFAAWSTLDKYQHPNPATPFDLRVWEVRTAQYVERRP